MRAFDFEISKASSKDTKSMNTCVKEFDYVETTVSVSLLIQSGTDFSETLRE